MVSRAVKGHRRSAMCPSFPKLYLWPIFGVFLLNLVCCPPTEAALVDLLVIPSPVPEKELRMKGVALPQWKKLWDEGRSLVRQGDFDGARSKYESLVNSKPKIEEARWEFSWLLIQTGEWEQAVKNLEILCESFPGRSIYSNALAIALRGQSHFSRALDIFQKNYSRNPDDQLALCGLAQALVEGGRKNEAYPLIRKVLGRNPSDTGVKLALANLAFEIGKLESARKLLVELAGEKEASLEILQMTGRVYERLGRNRTAAKYWQKILKRDPVNREARARLVIYHENRGQLDQAISHLESLLEQNPQNLSLLGKICRLYVETDRFADALPYFERYFQIRPDDLDALRSIININIALGNDTIPMYRRILAITPDDPEILNQLASDLLAAGEIEGALFMWRHISRMVPDRPEVLRAMADLLERLDREGELASVLQALHTLVPDDMQVLLKLAQMKRDSGELQASLEYYGKLQKAGYIGWALFEGRGQLYEELQLPAEAVADYEKLLVLSPSRNDIRRRCIILSGKLGDLEALRRLTEQFEDALFTIRMEDVLLVAEAYRKARDFGRAYNTYLEVLESFRDNDWQNGSGYLQFIEYEQALFGLSSLLEEEGLFYDAEQLLREYYVESEKPEALKRLFDLAIFRKSVDWDKAGVWFEKFSTLAGTDSGWGKLMKAMLLTSEDDLASAGVLGRQIIQDSVRGMILSDVDGREVARRAGILLADIYIEDGELADAERHCLAMIGNEPDMEVLVQLLKVYHIAEEHGAAENVFELLVSSSGGVLELLDLAELFKKHELPSYQVVVARKVLDKAPYSSRAGYLFAEAMLATQRFQEAIRELQKLQGRYPSNVSLAALLAHGFYRARENQRAIEQCDEVLERYPGRVDMEFLKARAAGASGDRSIISESIARLFPQRVEKILAREIGGAGLKVEIPKKKRSLWQFMTFSGAKQPSLADLLMAARKFVDNSKPQSRKRNLIAVKMYAQWQWEKAFLALADET